MAQPFEPVKLGDDAQGRPIVIGFDDFNYHVHLLGLSGRGKSRAIELLVRQLILNDVGVTLIDPHGEIYDAMVDWLAWMRGRGHDLLFEDRTVHLFDPCDPEFAPGYNPLVVRPGETPQGKMLWFLQAMAESLGGQDMIVMQWVRLMFTASFFAIADKGYTAIEAVQMIQPGEREQREFVFSHLPNRMHVWAGAVIKDLNDREYTERVFSTFTRLHTILQSEQMQRVLGAHGNLLNPLEVMDNGHSVIVNLKPRTVLGFDIEASKILGKILVNAYQQTANSQRIANKSRPHILIIDECHNYLSGDVASILDGTRKFGLHLVLSHQRIKQLRDAGDDIADAVIHGAQTKIIMGSTYETGLDLAREIFGGLYDLEQPFGVKTPHTVRHETVIREGGSDALGKNRSRGITDAAGLALGRGRGTFEADGEHWGHVTSSADGTGEGETLNADGEPILTSTLLNSMVGEADSIGGSRIRGKVATESEALNWLRSLTEQEGDSHTRTTNWQETLKPVIGWMRTATKSLDVWDHESALAIKHLDPQWFVLKRIKQRRIELGRVTTTTRPPVEESVARDLIRFLMSTTGICLPNDQRERDIETRLLAFRREAGPAIMPPRNNPSLSIAEDLE